VGESLVGDVEKIFGNLRRGHGVEFVGFSDLRLRGRGPLYL